VSTNTVVSLSPTVWESREPFVNSDSSKALTEFFQQNHEEEYCSLLEEKIEDLRCRLRISTLEDIPEFKPILDKISSSVVVQEASANYVQICGEPCGSDFHCCLELFAEQKLLVRLEYSDHDELPSVCLLGIQDEQIAKLTPTNPLKLAVFEHMDSLTLAIVIVEDSPLFIVLQKLINCLHLEESTSVINFAKFLSILGPACIINTFADESLSYREEEIQIKQPEWIIFDEPTYAALEAKLVDKFGYNSIISEMDILMSMDLGDRLSGFASYFTEVAIKRGVLVNTPGNTLHISYKLLQRTTESKGKPITYFFILTIP
jgi:hypothetical protein